MEGNTLFPPNHQNGRVRGTVKGSEIHFKGTRGGLLVCLDDGGDFDQIKDQLAGKLDAAQKFFQGSAVTIDIGSRALSTRQLLELEAIFSARYGVRILQVVNGGADRESDRADAQTPASAVGAVSGAAEVVVATAVSQVAVSGAGPAPAPAALWPNPPAEGSGNESDTLLVRRTLRSGQRISHQGNVVVVGDVNPGAEVVAAGDVVVFGHLRGVVHAGARGNDAAVVVALRLRPTQLRIGNHISRSPDGEPHGGHEVPEVPEMARIRKGEVVIDPYVGSPRLEEVSLS